MKYSPEATDVFSYQSYEPRSTIDGVEFINLRRSVDDGGSFIELARLTSGAGDIVAHNQFSVAQINYSVIEPRVIKAFHLHEHQTDAWFVPSEDRLLMVLVDVRKGSTTEGTTMRFPMGYGTSRLLVIPPGVAHGCRNLSSITGRIIYFVDREFDPNPPECQEGRLPWDYLGTEIWEEFRG